MIAFGATLRSRRLPVTTEALLQSLRALASVDLMERTSVYLALRTLLVSRIEEQSVFDCCFDEFWRADVDHRLHFQKVLTSEIGAPRK